MLKEQGIPPVPDRPTSWRTFLRANWGQIAAADFFTTEVWPARGLVTDYTLFVLDPQPTLLVALGDRTFFTLRHFAAMRRIPLHLTMHYTRAVRFGLEGEFNRQIAVALAGATAR